MSDPRLDYPRLVQDALRRVARQALETISQARPGSHHVYVSFLTNGPGVVLPEHLREIFPEEMKIVLQHQYWDLYVDDEAFSVTLSFGGKRHRLKVPFETVVAYYDVDADFALRFAPSEEAAGGDEMSTEVGGTEAGGTEADGTEEGGTETGGEPPKAGGKVVSLDAFRKK